MYQYNEFDKAFVHNRAAQFRDQIERWQDGRLSEDEFRPLRLQNGWYVQRHAPMLRVAVPYGELSSAQLRVLARVAREYDEPEADVYRRALDAQRKLGTVRLPTHHAHFTTRTNVQFNWIPLSKAADVMDLLATVDMHGIQTSGNCIRNISCDERAGVAPDEIADPRPFAEIMRQWTTLHPEFAFLPRKFKIAVTGASDDRAATEWHDVGLRLLRDGNGELGFRVTAGGGMGRTPVIGAVLREFLPWRHIMNYIEAVVRVYNQYGRRDNKYKARIKILVKAEGQRFIDEVEEEFRQIVEFDGGPHTIPQAEFDRVSAYFVTPAQAKAGRAPDPQAASKLAAAAARTPQLQRWLARNVAPHRDPSMRIVTLSFKRPLQAPGDASADQLERVADLVDRFSASEARVTHTQNIVLPWVHADDLLPLWQAARDMGLASANVHLLTDMIACPGGDFCALANARSLPVAQAITERYQDLDELEDIGEIDLHISGCINSCGHHHSGHIGVLGVDKDGAEWYQVTLGGSDGSARSGDAQPGRVIGPSFSAHEVPDVIDAVLTTYASLRASHGDRDGAQRESFIDTVRRVGLDPFKAAANAVRSTVEHPA
ncbi:nitrite/sulfite reductase [Paraburkholderia caballeronis]|uniref:Sulfite reductase (NADPH) hemoprotein beta-component n=1 Tax=Paraburkholderia caballeronis TaxID=416943 RepID=A0A1H7FYT6_9BURK|nr:nitrite/sulfite reductase [Paraburkholderia caballeronis]PXW24788.1 sulfite reductase (NADPH) hemoprotein beta-component [Paraburkholderia caballeronis]PXX00518.1 sulfite reductase (NADPH) hemoprotein beta-component [Paraburkholderia caballeronis]RAJ98581.1 sulfite reductase (NADPH) hemoprotein beta-component [Paraburkholderia caballeronis]SEE67385.1 sulfite reductase (NADPH) hemoprotein beta-component [Paraburkholderia caballeronis]SEK30964.1 sulfite reductase (NADPH) hemoprotein beta-comp